MAAVAPAVDKASDLLHKMSLETKSKPHDATMAAKKAGGIQNGAMNGEVKTAPVQPFDRSASPFLQNVDPSMCYMPTHFYYGGQEWGEDYSRYMSPDGVDMSGYGDMYNGYGYPYGAYSSPSSPAPTMGHDGQMYPQHYQYQASYYQPPAASHAPYTTNEGPTTKTELSASVVPDHSTTPLETSKVTNGVASGISTQKPNQQNLSLSSNGSYGRGPLPNGIPSSGYQDARYSFDGTRSPAQYFDGSVFPDAQQRLAPDNTVSAQHHAKSTNGRNQSYRPVPHLASLHNTRPASGMVPGTPGMINRMYPNNQMFNSFSTNPYFRSSFYDSRTTNGRWSPVLDSKYRPRGRGNGFYGYVNESLDGLSELNRGPRANNRFKNNQKGSTVSITTKEQNLSNNGNVDELAVPNKDQYNQAEFPDNYANAKFFIIKSYSEDDIHKSIKYNVWASTPNGNKKLDSAYQEAIEKAGGCPVFLFFSVNTSGQFVGVAEMAGPVDFNKTVDYWQQDKWTGCFSVKWHIVKDVPNNILKHIILENNDNKPVTNSRDTQEVKLEQGLQMLKLFKEHISKTSILDDFVFYESRQKVMQEKRIKQQQLQKQITDVKPVSLDSVEVNKLQKSFEAVTLLKKEAISAVLSEDKSSDEQKVVANGVANGC